MIAREFVEHIVWGPMVKVWKVIPTNRGGVDTASTREAIRVTQEGGLLGIFSEGRINMTEQFMLPCRPGAALIAARAGVPIVPMYIEGAPFDRFPQSPFLMPGRVRIYVGNPVRVSDFRDEANSETLKRVMLDVISEIARLAGEDDFQPQMAGKNWKPTREETLQVMEESYQRRRRAAKTV
jgi:1-acyl-sn-glycerol-3-phosphate acyltransferase